MDNHALPGKPLNPNSASLVFQASSPRTECLLICELLKMFARLCGTFFHRSYLILGKYQRIVTMLNLHVSRLLGFNLEPSEIRSLSTLMVVIERAKVCRAHVFVIPVLVVVDLGVITRQGWQGCCWGTLFLACVSGRSGNQPTL